MRQDDWQDWEGPEDREVRGAYWASILAAGGLLGLLVLALAAGAALVMIL